MTDHLFVYGTLRTGLDHPQARWLAANSSLLGICTIQGRLFRISWYPGLVSSGLGNNDRVIGELLRLHDPKVALRKLDDYEGVSEGDYERRIVEVNLKGRHYSAWVYQFLGPTEGLRWIPSGDFVRDLNIHFD